MEPLARRRRALLNTTAKQLFGLLPAAAVLLWLSLSSTPVSVNGAVSVAALAVCGCRPLRSWSMWLAAPAAVAVGMTAPHREDWVPWLVAAFAWRASLSTARLDEEREGTGITPVLFGISAVAAYLCLPDTEQIIPLAVVATATAIAAIVQPRVSFGRPGSMALIGLFGWIAAAGGIGRPAATIGGLGTLGVLVLAGGLTLPSNGLFVVMQSGCALVCSRLAGLSHDSRFAALVVAVALSVALSILVLSARWRPVRYR